ncbi:hypothetical protein SynBIOSE41_01589 [Synechococcus sp. BIOS-E4-1]|nr:hypothetical protein SynBIOSE41_01589 [Synechococcus sp. BIOS-E4-1]
MADHCETLAVPDQNNFCNTVRIIGNRNGARIDRAQDIHKLIL